MGHMLSIHIMFALKLLCEPHFVKLSEVMEARRQFFNVYTVPKFSYCHLRGEAEITAMRVKCVQQHRSDTKWCLFVKPRKINYRFCPPLPTLPSLESPLYKSAPLCCQQVSKMRTI